MLYGMILLMQTLGKIPRDFSGMIFSSEAFLNYNSNRKIIHWSHTVKSLFESNESFRYQHKTCAATANFPFVLIQKFHTLRNYYQYLKSAYGSKRIQCKDIT